MITRERAPLLEIERVSFSYGDTPALRDVSLTLAPGRFVGLLGPNASGKSTLVRLALGLLRPARGTVRLEGVDLARRSRGEVARRLALVPQGAALPLTFSALDAVVMGRTPHLRLLAQEGPADLAIAREALARVGAGALAERPLGALSGGERQLVLLARALAQQPGALLLDEPTTHLDVAHQVEALDLVARLVRERGLAALAVFHDLGLAAAYCDEVVLLCRGEVAARGGVEETFTEEVLRKVYGLRFPIVRHPASGRPVALVPARSGHA